MEGLCRPVWRHIACSTSKLIGTRRNLSRIGFIGLGNMGAPMAKNLLKKGHRLRVYDMNPQVMASLVEEGAKSASCPAKVSEDVECIITMLPNTSHVLDTYTGPNGVLKTVQEGILLIDSSTIDPSTPKKLSDCAALRGAVFMDAPVSGGVNAAKSGTLTFMVGGPNDEFEAAKQILLDMGTRVVHCGPSGLGQAAKLCNNLLLAISMIGTAEAMNLGIRLGLEAKLLRDIFNTSTGRCWSSELYSPVPGTMDNVPSANHYEGGFGTNLMIKDLGLAQTAATQSNSPIMLGSVAHQIYRTMAVHGLGNKDFSSVFKFLSETSEVS